MAGMLNYAAVDIGIALPAVALVCAAPAKWGFCICDIIELAVGPSVVLFWRTVAAQSIGLFIVFAGLVVRI